MISNNLKKLPGKILTILMTVLVTVSLCPSNVFAAGNAPGTRQIITKESIGGIYELYHSTENGHELNLYCFNSDLLWPHTSDSFTSDYYVPSELGHLSDDVKDKLYRIYYAGYPHNNVGLYAEKEAQKEHSLGELDMAVEPPPEIKALMPNVDWDELYFSAESVLSTGQEAQIMYQLSRYILFDEDPVYVVAAMEKPIFYYALIAYMYGHDTVKEYLQMYGDVYEMMSPSVYNRGAAHDATQVAIWRILYENNVPNNSKPFDDVLTTNQLVKDLVDFANGKGEHAKAYIPERGSTLKDLEKCKTSFETGASLERIDGTPVGKGKITFREHPDGYYVSELLRFVNEMHTIPYTIELVDSEGTVISSQTNYGSGWIEIIAPEAPKQAKIVLKTNHTIPSETYHYARENEASLSPEQLTKNNYQHMGGCYFESLPMNLELATEFHALPKIGDLTVKKAVTGNAADSTKAFDFKVTLDDISVNGVYGDMTFTNGVAEFTLKDGESKTAKDLPAGTEYTVTEKNYSADGYVTTKTGDTGAISENAAAVASFTNERNTYGNLKVTKTVEGNAGSSSKEFNFKVELKNSTLSGTYGDMTFTDGAAAFTLKDGESKTAKGLPNGTEYTVTEDDYTADGYVTTKSGDSGTIIGGDELKAAFTNTRNAEGSLTVSKTLSGNDTDSTKDFSFTIKLAPVLNGTYSGVAFEDGTATITLKGGESKLIEGLPNRTEYTVSEKDYTADGYVTTKTGDTGAISENTAAVASFTNERNTYGNLKVTKTVEGNAGSSSKEFNFRVELKNSTLSGTYGDMTFTDGIAAFTLKDGESKTAKGLPNGIEYTVTEDDYTADGYVTTKSGDSGTIIGDDELKAAFTNTRNAEGSLTVSKTLSGNDTDSARDFSFTIKLAPVLNGTYSGVAFEDGTATITLKGGESKLIEGLPNRTEYTVSEKDYTADGYVTTKTGDTGAISENTAAVASFTNERNTYGNLKVTKTVEGNAGSSSKEFNFKVELKNSTLSGTYGDMTFTDGIAAFTLKDGESKTAKGLPNGIEYTVTEDDYTADGYVTTKSGDSGTIIGDDEMTAAFINTNNSDVPGTGDKFNTNDSDTNDSDVPGTGDKFRLLPWIMLLIVSGAALLGTAMYIGKRKKNS